ncbi:MULTISPECIES: TadE/TadG family type IV pilus assembly protein [Amycolatopsis]|uniref:TadE/TadG family type IV pilus assembly protein n=1 Tax=Amycolatopsis TaxID=1813 RepID=UPI000B817033|nr:TadE/TadG family type IV pilus assembly protein [Amycolatopsis sacchari]
MRSLLPRDDRGSATVELTLLTPALILLLLFVVYCGRAATLRVSVNDATHQAARAATIARNESEATRNARATAEAALLQAGVTCRGLSVETQAGSVLPGSTVTVTVSCRVDNADLALLRVPGAPVVSATASSVVDRWRGDGRGANEP